jgi:hypothetical protein
LFVEDARGWRHVGDFNSEMDTSSVSVVAVQPSGIALLVESFAGNGWPPSRVHALAIANGHVVTVSSPEVAKVDVDDIGAAREVRIWQRRENINPYPDAPLSVARWEVARTNDGLFATETSLTPWVDVLSRFCTRAHAELADTGVLARVERCTSRVTELRWLRDGSVAATLGLLLRDADGAVENVDGELVVRRVGAGWRVVDVSCTTAGR